MTTVSKEAETLLQLAKKKNKHILIPNGFNFKNFMSKAEEIIINKKIGEIKHVDAAFSSSLTDLFQGIPLSESNNHTFQPHASTWSDPNKGGGYGWGQLSHMFAGILKITNLDPFCLSVPSPTKVDYTNAISMKFANGATGSFSGSAFVPKNFGGTFYITIHGTIGTLYLDMEIKRERLFVRLKEIFCLSVPSPTNVDYTNAVSMKFSNGATGSFSGSAFVPKDFGGTFYITVHGTLGVLYLDMELKRERLFVRLNNGEKINYEYRRG